METVHLILGVTVIASNLAAGVWGAACWYLRKPSVGFWYLLRFAQASVVLQVAVGGLLLLLGNEAADLHYLYGVLPVVVSLLAEGARSIATEHEMEGLDFEALPKRHRPAGRRRRDRPPRDRDHGRRLARDPRAGAARRAPAGLTSALRPLRLTAARGRRTLARGGA